MITAAFNIAIYTVLIFVIGMFKPQWPLFFMKNPSRMIIMIITLVGIMVSVTLFGEGNRRKALEAPAPPLPNSLRCLCPLKNNRRQSLKSSAGKYG